MAKLTKWRCWLLGCRGHIEHETDGDGVEWIGLRCVDCGKLKNRGLAFYQFTEAGAIARAALATEA